MKCFYCKGDMEKQLTNYIADLENCIIIIKNVPSLVCTQCGEKYYGNNTMKKIESILDSLENIITEVAVVNYDNNVA